MSDNNAGVEPVEKPQGVETKEAPAPEPQKTQAELDLEAELASKDAEIERIREERENYKRGMLKAKGKLPEEDVEETVEETIRRITREELLNSQQAKAQAEKDALIQKALRENKELKLALKNRSNLTPSGGSAGPEKEVIKDNTFSTDQIKDIKAKFPHWTDKEIEQFKQNLNR